MVVHSVLCWRNEVWERLGKFRNYHLPGEKGENNKHQGSQREHPTSCRTPRSVARLYLSTSAAEEHSSPSTNWLFTVYPFIITNLLWNTDKARQEWWEQDRESHKWLLQKQSGQLLSFLDLFVLPLPFFLGLFRHLCTNWLNVTKRPRKCLASSCFPFLEKNEWLSSYEM